MKKIILFCVCFLAIKMNAQQSYDITFMHDSLTVYGTFLTPNGSGKFPTIIINPGSGANDRNGTIPMVGANAQCLYPALLGDTLVPYKELAEALVDSGFAVLRYDKIEYTYTTAAALGTITFHKLWLPVESAIDYVKTRTDVDTANIILIGHSEGSSLIPYIARNRTDVKALISVAGPRTPFDSILAYQLLNVAQTCGANISQTQAQANQILAYFNTIRTNTWNSTTPAAFGAPANVWYDYIRVTDSVAQYYNIDHLPTLFLGMGADINVPPSELLRFENDVTITNDFWSVPDLIHYMTPNDIPHVSEMLTDTIVYWLREKLFTSGINAVNNAVPFQVSPNPFSQNLALNLEQQNFRTATVKIYNVLGETVHQETLTSSATTLGLAALTSGVYFLELNVDGHRGVKKIIKH